MRAFAYIRQSEAREGSVSPDVQKDEIQRFCVQRGYVLVETYADLDLSAYRLAPEKRPALQAMLRAAEDGGCDVIVFYRIDRLARRLEDQYAILASLKECGVRVDSVGQPWDESPEGRFMWDLSGALAALESRRLGKRIRDAHRRMAREGRYHGGLPPFGWKPRPDGKPGLVADPEAAPWRRHAHDWYQRGWSLRRIAKELNAAGVLTAYGRPWGPEAVRTMLLSPYQIGARETPEGLVAGGNVEPLLDEETYQRTVAVNAARGSDAWRRTGRPPRALFPGRLVRCATCGGRMSIWHDKAGVVDYICQGRGTGTCDAPASMRAHLLERIVVERLLTHIHALKAPRMPQKPTDDVAPLAREIDALRASLARLGTLCSEGEMTLEEYRQARDAQRAKLERAQRRLEQAAESVRRAADRQSLAAVESELRKLTLEEWNQMSLEARREVATLLIEQIGVSKAGVSPRVTVEFRW